jgi:hypothetical protein
MTIEQIIEKVKNGKDFTRICDFDTHELPEVAKMNIPENRESEGLSSLIYIFEDGVILNCPIKALKYKKATGFSAAQFAKHTGWEWWIVTSYKK